MRTGVTTWLAALACTAAVSAHAATGNTHNKAPNSGSCEKPDMSVS